MRLRYAIMGLAALTVLVAGGQVAPAGAIVGDCTPQSSWGTLQASAESQVIALVNAHRVAMGLNALSPAPTLVASAEWKSMDMAGYQYMDHNDPAPVARSIADRFAACGYPTSAAWGENIAYGFVDAQSVMNAWLSDVGHKANIENSSWTTIGVGVAQASNGLIFWTQDFGTTGGTQGPPPANDTQAPSTPAGLTGSATSTSSIGFSWQASTDNYGVAGYDVFLNGSRLGTTAVTTGTIGGLACGTAYTVGVDAYDASGNHSGLATKSVSTSACSGGGSGGSGGGGGGGGGGGSADTQAPTAPGSVTPSGVGQASLTLTWQASSDNVGVTGYDLFLAGNGQGSTTSLSGSIGGLNCGTTYTVGVAAHDAAGNESPVTTASVTTAACPPVADQQPPSVPGGLAGTAVSKVAVSLAWSASSDGTGVAGYDVLLNGNAVTTTTAQTYKFTGLACGTTYNVGVDAFDAAGNHSAVATTSVATKACLRAPVVLTPPSGLTAAGASRTAVSLNWQASPDAINGYGIYLDGTRVKSVGAAYTSTRIGGLACGETHTVGVDAYDSSGNRSPVVSTTVSTFACSATTKRYSRRR